MMMNRHNILAALLAAVALGAAAQPQVVAHRGFWRAEGSAQNSVRSLVKADSIGCEGTEFDVWMTRDGQLFVNHDPTINGVEIQKATAREVAAQRLSNGEPIPTLERLLEVGKTLKVGLVCELKPHADKQQEAQAVRKIVKLVKRLGLQDRVSYITFSYVGMKMLIKEAPKGTEVYYLNGELSPADLKRLGAAGLDYNYGIMRRHPEWFGQCRQLGLKSNVWTIDQPDRMEWLIEQGADFITTNEPEVLQRLIGK